MKKIVFAVFLFLILIFVLLFNYRPRPQQLTQYLQVPVSEVLENELYVQFLGNTNILLSDGTTSILTDGFFSRPNAFAMLFGKVSPNEKIIKECLTKASITKLDAVIPLHSHFDHALDAPLVAELTQATLVGSSSSAFIAEGFGLSESQIQVALLDSTIRIGKFSITFVKSNHWQYPDEKQREKLLNNEIEAPLQTPASIYDYKEGDTYTLLIQHDSVKIAIQGSAGYKENSLPPFDADILFLAIAGLDVMSEEYNQSYQDHLVNPLQAEVLVPIHWDDFTVKLSDNELKTPNMLFNLKFGSQLSKSFEQIEKRNPNKEIKILPTFEKISIVDILAEQ